MPVVVLAPSDVLFLRQKILRPTRSVHECVYPGDELGGHFGIRNENGELVSILSVYGEDVSGEVSSERWRIRGVATEEDYRGNGFAGLLLAKAESYVREKGGIELWCNARVTACVVYERYGYHIQGERFSLAEIGDHYRMHKCI